MLRDEIETQSETPQPARPPKDRMLTPTTWFAPGSRGFTLVELLAVIAILACLTLLALPSFHTFKERAREARAKEEIRELEKAINSYAIDKGVLPDSLSDVGLGVPRDPWGRPYVYVNIAGGGTARTGWDATPLNSDFDLYSTGYDGATAESLADPASEDDVVRANSGAFVGLGRDF